MIFFFFKEERNRNKEMVILPVGLTHPQMHLPLISFCSNFCCFIFIKLFFLCVFGP